VNTRRLVVILCVSLLALLFFVPSFSGQAAPLSPDHYPDYDERTQLPRFAVEQSASSSDIASLSDLADWSKLVFQSYRDGNWEIYLASPGGANQQRLTNNAAADIHPRLNRGGTRVAFASKRSGSYEIYAVNVNGTGLTRLTYTGTDNVNPAWSPAGDRIAFQSYRDGQAEIYVMNADGSNQTRITANAAYDGDPAWSPDGSKIAFVSNRTGTSYIWLMNSNGTELQQFSYYAQYNQNPVWSPDGKAIAWDGDFDGDSWQEIMVRWLNSDPALPPTVYDLNRDKTDAWVGSWSPDGRYIAYTQISYIYYYGNWYWTYAYARAWSVSDGQVIALIPQDTEWSPDWQTLDAQPPTPLLTVLPESPSPILVYYSGQDTGGSGVKDFDVQYRKAPASTWSDLSMGVIDWGFPLTVDAVGGETYYFRMRARDNAYNVSAWTAEKVTTVETYPPQSHVNPLPPYMRFTDQGFPVTWSVFDPGGSDIVSLEVQYRRDNQPWQDWLSNVSPPATFYGETGHTYAFRTKAVDRAQNAELWPEGDGDTQTTLYTWGITGKVTDNAGAPVSGAVITTTPSAMKQFYSASTGDYGAYVTQNTDWYTFTMGKPGYGAVPMTAFPLEPDAELDMVLPPVDNVVQDWGFESGDLSSGYWLSGSFTEAVRSANLAGDFWEPKILSDVQHTGEYAARMGMPDFAYLKQVYVLKEYYERVTDSCMARAMDGTLHIVWTTTYYGGEALFYASLGTQGFWSIPETIATYGMHYDYMLGSAQPFCDIGPDGMFHLTWLSPDHSMYYINRDQSGIWSSPEYVSNEVLIWKMNGFKVDDSARVHIIRQIMVESIGYVLQYLTRDSDGIWSTPYQVSSGHAESVQTAFDAQNNIHCIWRDENGFLKYRSRNAQGDWSQITTLTSLGDSGYDMAVGQSGVVHVIWYDYDDATGGYRVSYVHKSGNDPFSAPLQSTTPSASVVLLAHDDVAYILLGATSALSYIRVDSQGFSTSQYLGPGYDLYLSLRSDVDVNGVLHIVWPSYEGGYYYYTYIASSEGPVSPYLIANPLGFISSQYSVVAQDIRHLHFAMHCDDGLYYLQSLPPLEDSLDYTISQSISLPLTMTHPFLSFLYRLGGVQVGVDSGLVVRVEDALGVRTLFTDKQNVATWQHRALDMQPWRGQSVTVTFSLHQAAGAPPYAHVYLDEVSLGSARPDVWIAGTDTSGIPGESIVYTIDYGNQGGGTAQAVRITNTLPADITFVDASVLPVMTTPSLVWNVGTLAPQSAASQIAVTVTLAPTVTAFTTLTHTLEIAPQDLGLSGTLMLDPGLVELEIANNVTTAGIYVGKHIYLPLVLKKF